MKQLSFSPRFSQDDPLQTGAGTATPKRARPKIGFRRLRFLHISCFFVLWIGIIAGRLVWLQVVRHGDYVEKADKQQQRTFEVAPRRGILYDRNLHDLAVTALSESIYAVPSEIAARQDPGARQKYMSVAVALARIVHRDPEDRFTSARQIAARLSASRNFAWVARKLDPKEVEQVKSLGLKGVYTQPEFKRFYPNAQLAAQVLGYVGLDDNGLGGMEREFDRNLHGVPGRMLTAVDARHRVLDSEERDPQAGENLVLTIDENIQFIAERALDAALERTHAQNGTVVVQDPETGQILALAIRPTFDPNDFRHATTGLLRNHAVSDVYEPGSTFKLVTYSAALENKVTNPNEVIDCQGGKIELAGRIIHDDHPNGLLTTSQALWESSDVAAVKLALRMGSSTFYQYIRAYGFGSKSQIELPAETRGLLRPPSRWSGSSIGSLAMGQEVGVTPVQLVTMASTIANGGVYLPPHILLNRTDETAESGKLKPVAFHPEGELPDTLPAGAHRVISTMTSAEMRKLMEGVVLYGTGKNAQLNGYSAGGKTGTAQKIDVATHRYSKTKYVASFVGIAPISAPAITVAVIIDSPKGDYYGAATAAPVFKEVAQQVLEYLGVPHDREVSSATETAETKDQHVETPPPDETASLDALFDEVNHLPADDPLRAQVDNQQKLPVTAADASLEDPSAGRRAEDGPKESGATDASKSALSADAPDLSGGIREPNSFPNSIKDIADSNTPAGMRENSPPAQFQPPAGQSLPAQDSPPKATVVVDAQRRIALPSFVGEPVRQVVESAGTLGLGLQIVGSGIAREQVPAPGTMVAPGTGIVIRFSR